MRQSQLFTRTKKEIPADEVAKNAQLLIRAGYVYKEMAGVYTLLPLGYRVVDKITAIIKKEMDSIGGMQMKTSAFQKAEVWGKTDRWSDEVVDVWFKTKLKNDTELGLSFTNEEAYSNIMTSFISSYKDLPAYPYDFKTIFRNETRSKSGLMRGREFYWKALYSFSKNKEEHDIFYEKIKQSYLNIYKNVGLAENTFLTFALGGTFSKYSHEFQTISDAGEDIIYLSREKNIAINEEAFNDEVLAELGISRDSVEEHKAIEVGNIFSLGHKFSEPFDLKYKNTEGKDEFVYMGSYGIGITRLLGTIVETLSDEKGIVWPESVAPFKVHLVQIGENSKSQAEDLYQKMLSLGIEVLFDDRDRGAGEKFADADLIGIPHRVVLSDRSLEAGGIEYKHRSSVEKGEVLSIDSLLKDILHV